MTPLLIADCQIVAGLPPLGAVWKDAASTRAKLSKNMREFMAQRTLNFGRMLSQLWV